MGWQPLCVRSHDERRELDPEELHHYRRPEQVLAAGDAIISNGTLAVIDCTISSNTLTGIYSTGDVSVSNSTVSGNDGGMLIVGTGSVVNSAITNNGYVGIEVGTYNGAATTVTVANSVISGNAAGGLDGGGISNIGSTLTVVNSTIVGNSATKGGGVYTARTGGGRPATTTLINVTIAGNTASTGAGVQVDTLGTLIIGNTIIADNAGPQVTTGSDYIDFQHRFPVGVVEVRGPNLVEGGLDGFPEVLSADPKLGPLEDNGGPTQTMALLRRQPGHRPGHDRRRPHHRPARLRAGRAPARHRRLPEQSAGRQHDQRRDRLAAGRSSSLRLAVNLANVIGAAATITFDPTIFAAPQTIALTGGQLELSDPGGLETITGPAAGLTIDAGGKSCVFVVDGGVTASLSGLTITGGSVARGFGGGLENLGTVTLTDCTVSGNSASLGLGGGLWNGGTATLVDCMINGNSAGDGGGVYNYGTATLTDCTISGNSAHDGGGGLWNYGTATLTDCTISGNSANLGGGVNTYGLLTLTACTVSGNSAAIGGGVILSGRYSRTTIGDTIVAGNAAAISSPDLFGTVDQDRGSNLIGDGDGASGFTAAGDQVGTAASPIDPRLAPLGDYGGPTQTMALLPGSPAIDKGDNTLVPIDPSTGLPVTTDQRGFTRVVNGTVDIGAFEDQVVVTTPANAQATTAGSVATVGLGSFADSAINAGNSTVVVDFGDGSPTMTLLNVAPGSLGSVTHSFTSNGTYTVTVTATDQFSDANLGTLAVVAQATPTVSVNPVNITYGTALSNTQLIGTATWTVGGNPVTVAGTLTYTTAAGNVLVPAPARAKPSRLRPLTASTTRLLPQR